MLKENKWLIGLIAGALIASLGAGIGAFFDNDVTGEILSEDFLQILKMQKLASALKMCCGLSVTFWLVGIGNAVYGYYNDFTEKVTQNMLGAALIASAFLVIALIRVVPMATHKAEVRVGTVCDTDMSGSRVRNYTIEFEDGQTIGVTQDEYRSIHEGDTFYTIYCGDKLIEFLDMDDYRLPGEIENE